LRSSQYELSRIPAALVRTACYLLFGALAARIDNQAQLDTPLKIEFKVNSIESGFNIWGAA
jgi:hypothetical protein